MTPLGWYLLGLFSASLFFAALVVLTDADTRIKRQPPRGGREG